MVHHLLNIILNIGKPFGSFKTNVRIRVQNSLHLLVATLMTILCAPTAWATWSIVIVDTRTKEVVIGSATCLATFDLQRGASVVVPGLGAGAAQSYIDTTGQNRLTIWLGLRSTDDPAIILQQLEDQDSRHQTRQYGIVDTLGRAVTFTGSQAGQWADGLTGPQGTIVYAIQGNVLTGEPVVTAAEQAIRNTTGSLAEKLMAGMEAARDMGGDGRCSCAPNNPTGCGSPPPDFEKSAHIGYMIASRIGDDIGACTPSEGCANGDYYLNFNFAFMSSNDPDPVDLMRDAFEAWKIDKEGVPDAVQSTLDFADDTLFADGQSSTTLTCTLLDLNGQPITSKMENVTIKLTPETLGIASISDVRDLGENVFAVDIHARLIEGTAVFEVIADDGNRLVTLMPAPVIQIIRPESGFILEDPKPGNPKAVNEFSIQGGTTGNTVRFFWGFDFGSTKTPCGPILMQMPHYIGKATVDGGGLASLRRWVPGGAQFRGVHLQAIEEETCSRSNVITFQFEN